MRRFVLSTLLVLTAGLARTEPADGQFIDWIHRLSGPKMAGPGVSYYWGERSINDQLQYRFRMSGAFRWAVNPSEDIQLYGEPADDVSIHMVSIQPSIDFEFLKNSPRLKDLGINAGAALHWFGGDVTRAFWHWSFPVFLQWRSNLERWDNWYLRVAVGGQYFLKFHEEDFRPLETGVNKESGEFSFPALQIGCEFRWY